MPRALDSPLWLKKGPISHFSKLRAPLLLPRPLLRTPNLASPSPLRRCLLKYSKVRGWPGLDECPSNTLPTSAGKW